MVGIIFMEMMILRMTDDVLSVSTRVVYTLFIVSASFFFILCTYCEPPQIMEVVCWNWVLFSIIKSIYTTKEKLDVQVLFMNLTLCIVVCLIWWILLLHFFRILTLLFVVVNFCSYKLTRHWTMKLECCWVGVQSLVKNAARAYWQRGCLLFIVRRLAMGVLDVWQHWIDSSQPYKLPPLKWKGP